jgi:hypothetical protein
MSTMGDLILSCIERGLYVCIYISMSHFVCFELYEWEIQRSRNFDTNVVNNNV